MRKHVCLVLVCWTLARTISYRPFSQHRRFAVCCPYPISMSLKDIQLVFWLNHYSNDIVCCLSKGLVYLCLIQTPVWHAMRTRQPIHNTLEIEAKECMIQATGVTICFCPIQIIKFLWMNAHFHKIFCARYWSSTDGPVLLSMNFSSL